MSRVKGTPLPEIILQQGWERSPKVAAFIRALQPHASVPPSFVRHHASALWEHASLCAINGRLGDPEDAAIAQWCDWGGDPAIVARAVRDSGLLELRPDPDPDKPRHGWGPGWWLHDWEMHTGRLYINRVLDKDRKARKRESGKRRQQKYRDQKKRQREQAKAAQREQEEQREEEIVTPITRYAALRNVTGGWTSENVHLENAEKPSPTKDLACPPGIHPDSGSTSTRNGSKDDLSAQRVKPGTLAAALRRLVGFDGFDPMREITNWECAMAGLGKKFTILTPPVCAWELRRAAEQAQRAGNPNPTCAYVAAIVVNGRKAAADGEPWKWPSPNGDGQTHTATVERRQNAEAYRGQGNPRKTEHEGMSAALGALCAERGVAPPSPDLISDLVSLDDPAPLVARARAARPVDLISWLYEEVDRLRAAGERARASGVV